MYGNRLIEMIEKRNDTLYNVCFKTGKISKKRLSKSKPEIIEQLVKEEPKNQQEEEEPKDQPEEPKDQPEEEVKNN